MARNCWPDPKAGTLHGTGPGVAAAGSGSGSAVRYEATNGTRKTLTATLRMREKKMQSSLRLESKEGVTENNVGKR